MNNEKILDILKNALLLEKRGRAFYKKAKEDSKVEEVKKIFELMENEEEKHIEFLNKQFNSLQNIGKFSIEDFSVEFKPLEEKIFESLKEKIEIANYESMAIFMAITFEKEAVNFYNEKARNSITEDKRKVFTYLRDWEKTHVDFLNKIDNTLKEKIWYDNKFWPIY
jgi:rubrerythrin